MTVGIDRLRQSVLLEDIAEQLKVTPRTLGLDKQSSHHLAGGIVDGADQTQTRSPALQPVVRGTIDLKHHPFTGSSLAPAAVLNPAALSRGCAARWAKPLGPLLPGQL